MHLGTLKLGDKDQKWGAVSQTVFMTALLCALIVPMIFGGIVSLLTFASSAVIAILITGIAKSGKGRLAQSVYTGVQLDRRHGVVRGI